MNIQETVINYFAERKDVLCVYLFGSAAKGKENIHSDVDIAVLFDGSMPAERYNEEILPIVDTLSRILDRDVDIVALNSADTFMRFQVIKNGLRIYERPDRREHNFEAKAIMEYFDFLPIRKRMEDALIRNIKGA